MAGVGDDAGMDEVQRRLMFDDECILVDEQDNVVGHESKYTCHLMEKIESLNLLHRAFSVFLFNSKHELLLQQRSATKVTFPLVWTNTCCSHPLHRESELIQENFLGVRNAAQRKLLDELGIPAEDVPVDQFTPLGRMLYKAPSDGKWGEHELDYLLFIVRDVTVLPNPDEVANVKYVSREQLQELIRQADAGEGGVKLSPWFRLVVDNFLMGWWEHLEKGTLEEAVDMKTIHKLNTTTSNAPPLRTERGISRPSSAPAGSTSAAAMSKKKAVTTMTLKDFHGGSIPSELPLPSAPGVSARPPDRPTAAPSSSSVASARPRTPAASSAATAAAAIPSFLTNPSRIGRHFDEDERTPFEPATPRRPAPSPPSFPSAPAVGPARSGRGNAWGAKKEVAPAAAPAIPAASGDQIWSATRIAQASAVEKVISGRWQLSKPSSPTAPVSGQVLETRMAPPEMERPRSVGAREFDGVMERPGLIGVRGLENAMDRPRLVVVRDLDGAMERPRSGGVRGLDVAMEKGVEPVMPASHEGRAGEVKIGEMPERPKLKLLPRSKPIEAPAPSPTYVEDKQVHPVPVIASVMQVEVVHDVYQSVISPKTGVAGADTESRVTVDRPRLNLKPRSNAVGQSGESAAKERPSLFGGARPREQVLRERGVDALASDLEKTSPVGRSKNEFAKVEQKVEAMPNPSGEKADSFPSGHRGPRNADRKDYRRDTDRADAYRPTRREDNRKVARDVEKLPEQQRPEPETWRKPVEPPKPEVTAPRFGKAATALELAQAFSKSMSDTVPQSRLTSVPSPRVPPSPGTRDQVGFSRLTDNGALHSGSSQRKINGY